jgi:repressor LexA
MHKIQEKLLGLAKETSIGHLTLREMGEMIDEKFPQKIKHHLDQLEKKGLIRQDRSHGRIDVINHEESTNAGLISVPLVGAANCGPASIFATENIEGYLKISPALLKRNKKIFAIKAQGLSMNKATIDGKRIEDGDYLIVDSSDTSPQNGDIVLSIIDAMANIKRYIWDDENQQIVLTSDSTTDFPPIYIHADDDFIINGKVVQVIKKPKY